MSNEDTLQEAYKYLWRPDSQIPLQDFLTKFKPSMVQNDGTKPWIWVQGSEDRKPSEDYTEAYKEATQLLKEVTEKVENIKNDDTIPTRSNKKTGAKSKKEVREQVQSEATEQLKALSLKHGCVHGKWLIFAAADKVDQIWSGIAKSLVSGSLHETSAYLAKVATSSENENPNAQHLICVYLPDVYDKGSVAEVMKILLRNHGVNLSGVKSDLYTHIGIDSKHPSGIPSTVWKNAAILPEKEVKELKDTYFAELAAAKSAPKPDAEGSTAQVASNIEGVDAPSKVKAKPQLKKKVVDPFASEDDDEEDKAKIEARNASTESAPTVDAKEEAAPSKSKAKPKPKKAAADPFATDDDDEEAKVEKPKTTKAKTVGTKRAQPAKDESDDEESDRPKKKKFAKQ